MTFQPSKSAPEASGHDVMLCTFFQLSRELSKNIKDNKISSGMPGMLSAAVAVLGSYTDCFSPFKVIISTYKCPVLLR